MKTQKLSQLYSSLNRSFEKAKNYSPVTVLRHSSHSLSREAQQSYTDFTNRCKKQQVQLIKQQISSRRPHWKQDFYRQKTYFSCSLKPILNSYPSNNDKYNIQFLPKSLKGENFKLPRKNEGLFQPPKTSLLSDHFRPIVKRKLTYNENYSLRASLYGDTWVDSKRTRVLNQYTLQANPFRTPRSNQLISTMKAT